MPMEPVHRDGALPALRRPPLARPPVSRRRRALRQLYPRHRHGRRLPLRVLTSATVGLSLRGTHLFESSTSSIFQIIFSLCRASGLPSPGDLTGTALPAIHRSGRARDPRCPDRSLGNSHLLPVHALAVRTTSFSHLIDLESSPRRRLAISYPQLRCLHPHLCAIISTWARRAIDLYAGRAWSFNILFHLRPRRRVLSHSPPRRHRRRCVQPCRRAQRVSTILRRAP